MATTKEKSVKAFDANTLEKRLDNIEEKIESIVQMSTINALNTDIQKVGDAVADNTEWIRDLENIVTKIRSRMGI